MGKGKYLLLFVGILFLTGCGGGSKTLTCTMGDSDEMKIDTILEFDGDKVSEMRVVTTMDLGVPLSNDDIEDFEDKYKGTIGVSAKGSIDGTKFTGTVIYDVSKMSADDQAKAGTDMGNYDDAKKGMEALGLKCK